MNTTHITVPLKALVASSVNPRDELTHIDELAKSIKAQGILQPLLVEPDQEPGRYLILAGHRRAAAAKLAGLDEVPAILREPTAHNVQAVHLVENIQRRDLTPLEIGISVYQQTESGIKQKDLAEALGKPKTWVSKFATIGEAYAQLIEQERDTGKMAEEQNYSTLYDMARKILGLDAKKGGNKVNSGGKEEPEQMELTGDELSERDLDEGELEKIEKMRQYVGAQTGMPYNQIQIVPQGTKGWEVRLSFKNEKAVTEAFRLTETAD